MSSLSRIVNLKKSSKLAKGALRVGSRGLHMRPMARLGSSTLLLRELNLALVSGGLMYLTYSYFSEKRNPLEVFKAFKEYSTIHNDGGKLISSSGASQNGNADFKILSQEEVDRRLRAREQSFFVKRNKGLVRYDVAQLPSNNPIEDNHVEKLITFPSPDGSKPLKDREDEAFDNDLYFFGIFDGHSGAFTSAKLSTDLVPYVAHQIADVYQQHNKALTSDYTHNMNFDVALEKGFVQLDNDIVYHSLGKLLKEPTNDNMLAALPAISGSCALLAVYNSYESTVKVAVTGDSRALIGGLDSNGEWYVKSLSTDQTGDNLEEVQRIRSEHPGEDNVVRNGRVLGSLQPSRAFGDYRYKVKEIDGKKLSDLPDHLKLYFRKEPRDFKTPPYVTAKPVVTTAKVNDNTKFMVLASDGLFELLSNAEIAALVVKWMEKHSGDTKVKSLSFKKQLPKVKDLSTDSESQRPAFRYRKDQSLENMSYFLEDANVATHLIRNALSAGGQNEYVSTLVSIPAPMSRKYRDDLTVTVAFFGENNSSVVPDTQTILPNLDATTPVQPKL